MRSTHLAASGAALAAVALAACTDTPTAPARPRPLAAVSRDGAEELALRPVRDTLWIRRGGRDSLALRIARPAGLTDSVAVATDSVPAGLTARVAAPTLDTTATLVVAAAGDAPLGAYRIPLRATAGTGDAARSAAAELTVVVHNGAFSGPGGGNPTGPADAAWSFADSASAPLWVAYQEGDGPWTRVERRARGDTVSYAFTVRGRGGLAVVTRTRGATPADAGYELAVYYGTAAELVGFGRGQAAPAPAAGEGKRLTGTVAGGGTFSQTFVSLGAASASVAPMQSTFTLRNVAAGPQDLVAALSTFSLDGPTPSLALSKLIIRRGVDLADGAAIPALDFSAAEAFAPVSPKLEVTGADGAQLATSVMYRTAGGSTGMLSTGIGGTSYAGVPRDRQRPGDLHMLTVMALPPGDGDAPFGAGAAGGDDVRAALTYFAEARDRAVALGPALAAPSVAALAGGGYARWRATLARQPEYASGLIAQFAQDDARRHVTVMMTEGYVGDATSWEPAVPDLSAADGFDASWMPRPAGGAGAAVGWTVAAYGGDFRAAFAAAARGFAPEDGALFRYAMRAGKGAAAPAVAARRVR